MTINSEIKYPTIGKQFRNIKLPKDKYPEVRKMYAETNNIYGTAKHFGVSRALIYMVLFQDKYKYEKVYKKPTKEQLKKKNKKLYKKHMKLHPAEWRAYQNELMRRSRERRKLLANK